MSWREHLIIVPVLLPLLAAVLMVLLGERRHWLKATVNLLACGALLVVALELLEQAAAGSAVTAVYPLGNWPAPFGIVLVADRLSAMMVILTAILGLSSLIFALARWHRAGIHFHPLFQLLLMGINGAFLTGDLFNLFVFFEVLLAASYGLALHGSGAARVKAGLHYIAVNLAASSLFLIGAALLYGVTGTLNMADLAARASTLSGDDRMLLEAGAAVLGTAFLIKAAVWPLGFWLPTTYAAACAPVAAMFAILSKVGLYAVLRMWLLLFGGGEAGLFAADWLLVAGIMTVLFGAVGVLGAQELPRVAGYCVLVSSGTLLAVLASGQVAVTAAALFYLISSTLAVSAFFLLVELAERGRVAGAHILAVTLEAFGSGDEEPEEEPGVAIPATMAILGISFVLCALLLAGLPPVSGFIAKFAMLTALFNPLGLGGEEGVPTTAWVLLALLLGSGLTTVIAMARAGMRLFWTTVGRTVPRVRVIEMLPVATLLGLCLALTVGAGPVMEYLQETAAALHAPAAYAQEVLGAPRQPGSAP